MSRVIYANTQSTSAQEQLRITNAVRLVTDGEEGMGVNALPNGVYGFTYSPALPSAPLFSIRRFRSFETHKLQDGTVLLIAFIGQAAAKALETPGTAVEVSVQPEPEEGADTLVAIPYSWIRHHHQFSVPTEHGATLQLRSE